MNNIIFKTLLLKGEAGNDIQSVEKTATSGLVDTYTITLTDGSTHTFNVTNGKSIVSIEKTSSVGYVDTYTITYNDGSTDTFEITLATITVDDALSDSSTNPVENRVVTGALNNKSNNSNLATVESGTTASQAYTVGDYLVYNGQLCKVISAIAQGDTLTVGTNIEVTTSGGEFKKINSDLTQAPIDITNLFSISDPNVFWSAIYNPIAKTVKLSCYGHGSYPNGSIRFTVPQEFAFNLPNQYIIGALGSVRSSNDTYAFVLSKFNTSNNIQQVEVNYSQGITAEEVSFSVEYRVVD